MERKDCQTITVDEAAGILGCNRKTVYDGVRAGTVPHIKLGRKIVIPKVAFDRWLRSAGAGEAA